MAEKVNKLMLAAGLLECESLTTLSRAKLLQNDLVGFLTNLTEAAAKLEAMRQELVGRAETDYFVAVPESSTLSSAQETT